MLVHGAEFMVDMPIHEEKRLESVLFLKYVGHFTGKFHSDGNTGMEASFLVWWDHTHGKAELEAELEARGDGASPVVTLVAIRPKTAEVLLLAGAKPLIAEATTLYRSVLMRVNHLSLPVSGPSSLVIRCRISCSRDEESFKEFKRVGRFANITWSFGGVVRCSPRWRLGNTQIEFWNHGHVGSHLIDQAWALGAEHFWGPSNAERLVSWSELRNSHAVRQPCREYRRTFESAQKTALRPL